MEFVKRHKCYNCGDKFKCSCMSVLSEEYCHCYHKTIINRTYTILTSIEYFCGIQCLNSHGMQQTKSKIDIAYEKLQKLNREPPTVTSIDDLVEEPLSDFVKKVSKPIDIPIR